MAGKKRDAAMSENAEPKRGRKKKTENAAIVENAAVESAAVMPEEATAINEPVPEEFMPAPIEENAAEETMTAVGTMSVADSAPLTEAPVAEEKAPSAPIEKKRRGRQKKANSSISEATTATTEKIAASEAEKTVKKKPGRPKKAAASDAAVSSGNSTATKKPGRPRKTAPAAEVPATASDNIASGRKTRRSRKQVAEVVSAPTVEIVSSDSVSSADDPSSTKPAQVRTVSISAPLPVIWPWPALPLTPGWFLRRQLYGFQMIQMFWNSTRNGQDE